MIKCLASRQLKHVNFLPVVSHKREDSPDTLPPTALMALHYRGHLRKAQEQKNAHFVYLTETGPSIRVSFCLPWDWWVCSNRSSEKSPTKGNDSDIPWELIWVSCYHCYFREGFPLWTAQPHQRPADDLLLTPPSRRSFQFWASGHCQQFHPQLQPQKRLLAWDWCISDVTGGQRQHPGLLFWSELPLHQPRYWGV